jgi:hypothetical protein
MPASRTWIPLAANPAAIADSSISPDARVSLPTTTVGKFPSLARTRPAARANFSADSAVIGSLFAMPRIPSVPNSFCDTGHLREGDSEVQPGNEVSGLVQKRGSRTSRSQSCGPTFKPPTIGCNVNVLLDQVPNCRCHGQGHQFCTPVFEEESLHAIKAWCPVPAKCRPRC